MSAAALVRCGNCHKVNPAEVKGLQALLIQSGRGDGHGHSDSECVTYPYAFLSGRKVGESSFVFRMRTGQEHRGVDCVRRAIVI